MCQLQKTPLQWLQELSKINDSSTKNSHNAYEATTNFLSDVFNDYAKKKMVFDQGDRKEAASLLLKSLPAIEKGLNTFYVGYNADKRVGAQTYLSGLQFLFDDLKADHPCMEEKGEDFSRNDILESLKEEVKNSKDSETWGDVPSPNLENVPKSHTWWDWE